MDNDFEPFHWEYILDNLSEDKYKSFIGRAVGLSVFYNQPDLAARSKIKPGWKKYMHNMPSNFKFFAVLYEKDTDKPVKFLYYDPSDRGFYWDDKLNMYDIENLLSKDELEMLFDSMMIW